jgi:hypothetical protein
MAKLSRPLTPAEVKRGFTGKVTADGRALVRFQGRVFAVPARGVSGLIKPAANQSPSASRLTTLQRQQRDTRIAAIVAGQPLIAAAGGGSRGGGGPLSRSVPANNNIKPLRVYRQPVGRWDREAAIKRTLSDFGVPNDKLGSYLKGVDLSKPVIMRRYPKGTIFTQYSFPNQPGAWFTTPGTPMNKLGISEFGEDGLKRQEFRYIAKNDVYMLESTAADFTDESGSVLPGGGYQLFTNDKNAFEIHDPSTN